MPFGGDVAGPSHIARRERLGQRLVRRAEANSDEEGHGISGPRIQSSIRTPPKDRGLARGPGASGVEPASRGRALG